MRKELKQPQRRTISPLILRRRRRRRRSNPSAPYAVP